MCLIVDADRLVVFFSKDVFADGRRWVRVGRGKLIIGGKQYRKEVRAAGKSVVDAVAELVNSRKTAAIDDARVDRLAGNIKEQGVLSSNDAHIIALALLSGCKVVCTADGSLRDDIRRRFQKNFGQARPRLYDGGKRHAHLICDENVVACCK